ncbi:MAG: HAD-IA family hydrolase [Gemmataceae bacterium]
MIPPGVKAIFFDAVGTLLHPDPPAVEVYVEVGHRFGSRLSASAIGANFIAAFKRQDILDFANGLATSELRETERWRAIVAQTLEDLPDSNAVFRELFAHFSRSTSWRSDPDSAVVLAELAQRGYLLGMASNFDSRLRSIIREMPALQHIRQLVISSEVGWRKPGPQFFHALCESAKLPPQDICLVGDDWTNDFQGATAAGLRPLFLDSRKTGRAGAAVIHSLAQLL